MSFSTLSQNDDLQKKEAKYNPKRDIKTYVKNPSNKSTKKYLFMFLLQKLLLLPLPRCWLCSDEWMYDATVQ